MVVGALEESWELGDREIGFLGKLAGIQSCGNRSRFRSALFQIESPERVWTMQLERYLDENRAALDRVRAICDAHDAELIVALHPDYVTSQLSVAAACVFLQNWTDESQIRFLDLTRAPGFQGVVVRHDEQDVGALVGCAEEAARDHEREQGDGISHMAERWRFAFDWIGVKV